MKYINLWRLNVARFLPIVVVIVLSFRQQVEKALKNVAAKTKLCGSEADNNRISTCPETDKNDSTESVKIANNKNLSKNNKLKGVSLSILERIREKEQRKLELAMTRDPKLELKLARMERLPAMSRILKTYFTSERKAAITMEDCVRKLSESSSSALQPGNE